MLTLTVTERDLCALERGVEDSVGRDGVYSAARGAGIGFVGAVSWCARGPTGGAGQSVVVEGVEEVVDGGGELENLAKSLAPKTRLHHHHSTSPPDIVYPLQPRYPCHTRIVKGEYRCFLLDSCAERLCRATQLRLRGIHLLPSDHPYPSWSRCRVVQPGGQFSPLPLSRPSFGVVTNRLSTVLQGAVPVLRHLSLVLLVSSTPLPQLVTAPRCAARGPAFTLFVVLLRPFVALVSLSSFPRRLDLHPDPFSVLCRSFFLSVLSIVRVRVVFFSLCAVALRRQSRWTSSTSPEHVLRRLCLCASPNR